MALQEHGNADFGGSEIMRALTGRRTCSQKMGEKWEKAKCRFGVLLR